MGMERLVLLLGMRETRQAARPALFLVWVGDAGRAWAFNAAHKLRRRGIGVEMDGEKKSLKSQMRRADKLRAPGGAPKWGSNAAAAVLYFYRTQRHHPTQGVP